MHDEKAVRRLGLEAGHFGKELLAQRIQVGRHRSVENPLKLVSVGHHADAVRIVLGPLFVHELVDRLIGR